MLLCCRGNDCNAVIVTRKKDEAPGTGTGAKTKRDTKTKG